MFKRMMEILDELMEATPDKREKLNQEYTDLYFQHFGVKL